MESNRKVTLVTGAGTGIGRAVAIALAGAGYSMVLAGRREDRLAQTATMLAEGTETLVVPTDVSDPAAVAALFAALRERFGRIDLLFNNAGIGVTSRIEDLSVED